MLMRDAHHPRLKIRLCNPHRIALRRCGSRIDPENVAVRFDCHLVREKVLHKLPRPIGSCGGLSMNMLVAFQLTTIHLKTFSFRSLLLDLIFQSSAF